MAKRTGSGRGGSGGRNSGGRNSGRRRQTTTRHYPRTARLNALLTEIIADHFERVDHDDLGFVTITGAEVDADLNICQVYVSTLAEPDPVQDDIVLDALAEERKAVQRAIASQAKLRKTPEVLFAFDPAVRAGARIDSILATLDIPADVVDANAGSDDGGSDDDADDAERTLEADDD